LTAPSQPLNGETFDVKCDLAQDSNASSEGSFAINGTASFRTSRFRLGTLSGGIFPSGSFIIGRSVALKIETQNGIVNFVGTADLDNGDVNGEYTVTHGTRQQRGTAVLVASMASDLFSCFVVTGFRSC
jgi:hypothetical protein